MELQTMKPKSPLRYIGGKSRAVKILEKFVPIGTKEIISPFFGGGSFEIHLAHQGIKVHGFDNYRPLVNFWKHLLNDSQQLADSVYEYWNITKDQLKVWQKEIFNETNTYKQAVMFFVLNRTTFSGIIQNSGFKSDLHNRFSISSINNLRNFNINNISVEFADFADSLANSTDTLKFLDPPYHNRDNLYLNKNELFPHEKSFGMIKNQTKWILTYNDTEYIRELYKDFKIQELTWTYGAYRINGSPKKSSEIVILNI